MIAAIRDMLLLYKKYTPNVVVRLHFSMFIVFHGKDKFKKGYDNLITLCFDPGMTDACI